VTAGFPIIVVESRRGASKAVVPFLGHPYNIFEIRGLEHPLLSAKPKLLFVGDSQPRQQQFLDQLRDSFDVVHVQSPLRALGRLARESFGGLFVSGEHLGDAFQIGKLLQNERILEGMPDGIVVLDAENTIIWGNGRMREWTKRESVIGSNFYTVLGSPEILGPDFCPFHTALATSRASTSTLRSGENHYFQVHAAPVFEGNLAPQHLIVTVRDVTNEMLQQQKLAAIHQAGIELADLMPDELSVMSVEERIELLKKNILHFTKDLLHFDVVEIRLLDGRTGKLEPLLAVGIIPEAAGRDLFARPQNNGVTGFVASTGKSYLCEDTTADPLYLEGCKGAKSSLTVPLVLHDEVIGTFNVESPEPRAFSESDLQFLEIFTRDVAVALNTLELLRAEKATTAQESVEAIHSAVALPVDDILNDAVNIMERYIGHEPEVVERLQGILRNARDIKQLIQKVGQKMAPAQAHPEVEQPESRTALRGRRVLVADADESVRSAAHNLLERYGCVVETAHDGAEAIYMVRNMALEANYDVVIVDIRLPDMTGYELLLKLQEIIDPVPLVLMTGFGYDPGHSIVKARQAKLPLYGELCKPFRLDQLLDTVERIVRPGAGQEAALAPGTAETVQQE
jgi:CheY-like chemotaxis protein/PAS domain-containing protein